jgi:hypothetical protein
LEKRKELMTSNTNAAFYDGKIVSSEVFAAEIISRVKAR